MIAEHTIEQAAKEAVGNWQEFDSFAWDGPDDSDQYTIVYTENRDSGLLEQSNAEAIAEALQGFDDVRAEHHNHWAVGWIDGYAIRVYRDGDITAAFRAWFDVVQRLADYPVLDEQNYSNKEYENTLENICNEAHRANRNDSYVLPDDYADQTYSWLWNNNQSAVENTDDQGGYPSESELQEAWDALGYRIIYVVTWIDCGQESEEFDTEEGAEERVMELRKQGFDASYTEQLPELEK
jgi:hypothetical protein